MLIRQRPFGNPEDVFLQAVAPSPGGRTRPLSSPWVMTTPPIIRVDMPHEVVCGTQLLLPGLVQVLDPASAP
jgi:hypothetical protein